jgi:ABC-type branched-subunit amino acid transport system substrate-binding protein
MFVFFIEQMRCAECSRNRFLRPAIFLISTGAIAPANFYEITMISNFLYCAPFCIDCSKISDPGPLSTKHTERGCSMKSIFRFKAFSKILTASAALASLASCGTPTGMWGRSPHVDTPFSAPVTKVQTEALPGPDRIGSGPVKVALILPLTQASGPSVVGTSLRNAAELAMSEAGGNDLTLLIEDDHSNPEGAKQAAQTAISYGADLIIGPLFAGDVREVSKIALSAGKPMIAFSTDTSVSQPGVYLLSFLIEGYVDRIVDYAASKGKKSIAALIPDNDYGRVAEAAFQQAAARDSMRVLEIDHYQAQTLPAATQKIAALGDQIDSLFIPEQADSMPAMSEALINAGVSKKIQILSTGLWNDTRVLRLPALQGAWFAAPENGGYNAFVARYKTKFGSEPARIATLSYDAVSLAAALAHTQGNQRYSDSVLTNRSGFNGADGVFRFRSDGTNDRGLAVLQINNGAASKISPAPRSFAGIPSGT